MDTTYSPLKPGEYATTIEIDIHDNHIYATTARADDFTNGTGIPAEVYNGFTRRIYPGRMNYRQANRLMRALTPYVHRAAQGTTVRYQLETVRPHPEFTPDARAALQDIDVIMTRLHDAEEEAKRKTDAWADDMTQRQYETETAKAERKALNTYIYSLPLPTNTEKMKASA